MNDRELDKLLLATFFRRDCPETMILGDYRSGWLKRSARDGIRTHVERCPHCTAELANLEGFLRVLEPQTVYEPAAGWVEAAGFVWRRLTDQTQLVIRFLQDALAPPPIAVPLGVKSSADDEDDTDVLQEIYLSPEETDGYEITALVLQDAEDDALCVLRMRVQALDRWPDLIGTQITATADDWTATGETDAEGEVVLRGLSRDLVEKLSISISLKGG